MAFAEIERILGDAKAQWPQTRVMLQHRLGLIPVGEASIAIHAGAAAERQARVAEQRARIEREAAERLARDEEGDIAPDF